MTTVTELIIHLQKHYQPNDTVAAALWQIDDVLYRAEDTGKTITREQAGQVLEAMHNDHDASLGICWDTIDCHIHMLLDEN